MASGKIHPLGEAPARGGRDAESLMRRADEPMYVAKQARR